MGLSGRGLAWHVRGPGVDLPTGKSRNKSILHNQLKTAATTIIKAPALLVAITPVTEGTSPPNPKQMTAEDVVLESGVQGKSVKNLRCSRYYTGISQALEQCILNL